MPVKARSAKARYRITSEIIEAFHTREQLDGHECVRPPGQPYGPCAICEDESAAGEVLQRAFRLPPWGFCPSGLLDGPPHESWLPHRAAEWIRTQEIRAAILDVIGREEAN